MDITFGLKYETMSNKDEKKEGKTILLETIDLSWLES